MCIIVAKPMNVKMPDAETLRECFGSNPDGAGFMYADGKTVRIRKGFMSYAEFAEALEHEVPENMREATAIVMHFRIATHGKVQPSCCHPFPISDDMKELGARRFETSIGVAHNGIIQGRKTSNERSDTMDFIAKFVTPLRRISPLFMFDDDALDLLEDACGSKLAFLNYAGEISTVGNFIEDESVLYSNSSYLKVSTRYNSYGDVWGDRSYYDAYGYGAYDDADEMEDLIAALPYSFCADCLWNEDCAMAYPICDTAKAAKSLSADILEEEGVGELIDAGFADEQDMEYYKLLKASNDEAWNESHGKLLVPAKA